MSDVLRLPEIFISMVGPRAVGKSSLLASMYGGMQKIGVNFSTNDDIDRGRTNDKLAESIKNMQRMIAGLGIRPQKGIAGTSSREEFHFIAKGMFDKPRFLSTKSVPCELPFTFVDFPGGWFTSYDHNSNVQECLTKSAVIFLTVEANALMEGCPYHEHINEQMKVQTLFTKLDLKYGQNVIIVLMKCEKYLHNGQKDLLMKKASESYDSIVRVLKNKGVSVFLTSIETIGGLEFTCYGSEEKQFEPRFRITGEGYNPQKCEVPLWLAVTRASKHLHEQATQNASPFWTKLGFSSQGTQKAAYEKILENLNNYFKSNNSQNDFIQL